MGVERSAKGPPVHIGDTSSMATAVAGPDSARASVNSSNRVLPAFSFYFPPPAFLLPFPSSFPHPSKLSPVLPQLSPQHSSASATLLQTHPSLKLDPRAVYILQTALHPASTLSSRSPSFRRPKPLSLSLVYLSRKGFESQAP
jgi:hypothetical protein